MVVSAAMVREQVPGGGGGQMSVHAPDSSSGMRVPADIRRLAYIESVVWTQLFGRVRRQISRVHDSYSCHSYHVSSQHNHRYLFYLNIL